MLSGAGHVAETRLTYALAVRNHFPLDMSHPDTSDYYSEAFESVGTGKRRLLDRVHVKWYRDV